MSQNISARRTNQNFCDDSAAVLNTDQNSVLFDTNYGSSGKSEPEGINSNRISADFQNGLLEVTVQGGADHPEPERIQIESRTS